MWNNFRTIGEQASRYSTVIGKVWYVLTFVFRMIVIATLGGSVFGDDLHSFRCNTNVVGCRLTCYQDYMRITHMKLWSFHLLSLIVPIIAFQWFATYKTGQVVKLKKEEEDWKLKEKDDEKIKETKDEDYDWDYHQVKMKKRKERLGKVREKTIYKSRIDQIAVTKSIKIAYVISVLSRLVIEAVFIYMTVNLYDYEDPHCRKYPESFTCGNAGWWSWLWLTVPSEFICDSKNVWSACRQHLVLSGQHPNSKELEGFVRCYIGQSFQKSVYLRYMQIAACVGFLLCAAELIYIPYLEYKRKKTRKQRKEAVKAAGMEMKEVKSQEAQLTEVVCEMTSTSTSRKRSVSSKSKGAAAAEKPSAASTSQVSETKDQKKNPPTLPPVAQ